MIGIKIYGLRTSHKRKLRRAIAKSVPAIHDQITVEVVDDILERCYDSLWYGGEVARIQYKGWVFDMHALGDVYATLYRGSDRESPLLFVKDKRNAGLFGEMVHRYIKSDDRLRDSLSLLDDQFQIVLENNNWWECFPIDPDGNFHDMMWALDSDNFFDAIAEITASMDSVIKELS